MRVVAHLLLIALVTFSSFAQSPRVFFGSLHSHTAYSDGTGTPQQAFDYARTTGKLDFLVVSEHNHKSAEGTGDDPQKLHIAKDHTLYNGTRTDSLLSTAARVNQQFTGSFVALYGQEFSVIAKGNHLNVFDVGEVIDEAVVPSREFRTLYEMWLPSHLDSTGKRAFQNSSKKESLGKAVLRRTARGLEFRNLQPSEQGWQARCRRRAQLSSMFRWVRKG